MIAGSLTYNTELNTKGFQKGVNDVTSKTKSAGSTIKNIVAGLGITKIISAAFSMITSNIDGAVKRIDALNNFPKVMSNLGIGANESSQAIKQLSNNLKGLPTTLNDGALAVQRFTSKNGDVKKSVELFTAVNNAILAGGASTDIQTSALEQLSQAYAKGKPDMMEWRSLMTAMPAQLKQVAQAMGYVDTDQLGEELRSGRLSMDEFLDMVVKLNKEGSGEFASFEEQAKNSTGGIGTSVKNMETAITRGVANIIQSIDESLKGAGFDGISDIISGIGQKTEGALNKVAEIIKNTNWKAIGDSIKEVIPIDDLKEMATKLRDQILPIVEKFRDKLMEFFQKMQPTLEKIKEALIEGWEKIKPKIEPLINSFTRLMEVLEPIAEQIMDFMQPLFDEWGDELIKFIGILANVIGFFTDMSTAWNNILSGILTFFTDTIPNALSSFSGSVESSINTAIDIFNNLPYYIGTAIGNAINFVFELKDKIIKFGTVTVPQAINSIIEWFKQLPNRIRELLNMAWDRIKEWINNIRNTATNKIPSIVQKIIDFFKELPNKMLQIGKDIVTGLWNGIIGAKDWLTDKIGGFAGGILQGMKDSLGIHSPSTLFRDQVGKFIPQGVAVGIRLDTVKAVQAIDDMNKSIMNKMQDAVNIETGKMNASANIKANNSFDNTIVLNATFDGSVEMESRKVGTIIAPTVTRAIKAGGLV